VELLVANKHFDPDVVVRSLSFLLISSSRVMLIYYLTKDESGWTPLMIAASLKNGEGDSIIDLLLRRGADVNIKSTTGQARTLLEFIPKR
jgi:26S proteasome non-ATPase regulatory subunit 10